MWNGMLWMGLLDLNLSCWVCVSDVLLGLCARVVMVIG